MESVLKPVESVCRNYIDDVVVYSGNWDDHIRDLGKVLKPFHRHKRHMALSSTAVFKKV